MKTSSRHVFKTSSRYVFKTSSRDFFKTSSRRLERNNFLSSKTSSRRLEDVLLDVFKTFSRCFQDVFARRLGRKKNCYAEEVLKTSSRQVLKTSSRRLEDQQMFSGRFIQKCFNVDEGTCMDSRKLNKLKSNHFKSIFDERFYRIRNKTFLV